MKKWLFISISTVIIASGVTEAKASSEEKKVFVLFEKGTTQYEKRDTVEELNGEVTDQFKHVSAVVANVPENKVKELKKQENVVAVSVEQPIKMLGQSKDWGIDKIGAPISWASGYTGKDIKIAVLDSGISSHGDLKISGGKSFVDYTSSYRDDHGHGTHVAGIIAGLNNTSGYVGAAYDAKIYALKILDSNGEGDTSSLASAIDWCITNGMDVINLSLGFQSDDPAIKALLQQASNKGILIVAAAGNAGAGANTVDYPAKYDTVIAVGSVNQREQRSYFSSTGPALEVVAPGEGIMSTYLGSTYAEMDGTSMAAPYVSAQLALMKEAYPSLATSGLRKKLSENVKDLGTPGRDSYYGYGLIQSFQEPETVAFNQHLTVYGSVYVYQGFNGAKSSQTASGAVYAYEQKGSWFHIGEDKWIKPDYYIIGKEVPYKKIIQTQKSASEYKYPTAKSALIKNMTATAVEVDKKIGDWYHWKQKNTWIKGEGVKAYDYKETSKTITTLATSTLYGEPSKNQTKFNDFAPQPINITAEWNGWFRSNGKWFQPLSYYNGTLPSSKKTYTLTQNAYLYHTPAFSYRTDLIAKKGETVNSLMVRYEWVLIEYKKQYKWIPLRYLKASPAVTAYAVKKGDTLYKISKTYQVSVTDLVKWNNLKTTSIKIGQKLIVKKASK